MKIVTISDVHSQWDKLQKALKKAKKLKYDKLVFLGDWCDRGPNPDKILKYIIKHYKDKDKIFILGNHDVWIKKYLNNELHLSEKQLWLNNEGLATMTAIDLLTTKQRDKLKDAFNSFVLYYQYESYIFTHAGIPLEYVLTEMSEEDTWGEIFGNIIEQHIDRMGTRSEEDIINILPYYFNMDFVVGHWLVQYVDESANKNKPYHIQYDSINIYLTDYGSLPNDNLGIFQWITEDKHKLKVGQLVYYKGIEEYGQSDKIYEGKITEVLYDQVYKHKLYGIYVEADVGEILLYPSDVMIKYNK